jgi:uncharacterized protein
VRRFKPLALIAILVITVASCAGGTNQFPPASQPGAQPLGAQWDASQPVGPDAEELIQDMDVAVQVVNNYWNIHWSEFFTGTYTPPRVVGLYDASTSGGEPTCGGQPVPPDNALYCSTGEDFLAWDVALMAKGAQYGDSWVYLVIAHEWAHAIQYRLSEELQTLDAELQADCLAGAVLYGAARDGTLQFEQGDEREITIGLTQLADETPWTQEGDHGDAFQRIQSFALGRNGGVTACLPGA